MQKSGAAKTQTVFIPTPRPKAGKIAELLSSWLPKPVKVLIRR
jgi:hypothetical protein